MLIAAHLPACGGCGTLCVKVKCRQAQGARTADSVRLTLSHAQEVQHIVKGTGLKLKAQVHKVQ